MPGCQLFMLMHGAYFRRIVGQKNQGTILTPTSSFIPISTVSCLLSPIPTKRLIQQTLVKSTTAILALALTTKVVSVLATLSRQVKISVKEFL